MSDDYIVGIAIFSVLSVFVVAIIIGVYISKLRSDSIIQPIVNQGGFLSPCTDIPCNNNFICDGSTFLCKLNKDSPCNNSSECSVGFICSGLCVTGNTGGLNDYCPCNQGYTCTKLPNSLSVCKGSGGTNCNSNNDCFSGFCKNNTCTFGFPNSYPCDFNAQCSENNCSNGYCQPPNIITGNLGAACAGDCVGFTGALCTVNSSVCQCKDGIGSPGVCVTASQGVISPCSNINLCSDQLVCYKRDGSKCSGSTGCLCTFTYNDPNTVDVNTVCINGMSSKIQQCYNNPGMGCDNGGLCFSNICNGDPVLAVYTFTPTETDRNNFVSSTSTSISVAITGPSLLLNPHKMFATSNGQIDTIYLVDNIQGLLYTEYNPITSQIITPWTILIPHSTPNKVLIDVGYNGTNFLVAFTETSGSVQNDTVYIGSNVNSLTLFNSQSGSGLPGTQYTTGNIPLSINYIDIAPTNNNSCNAVLLSYAGTVYIKQPTQTKYDIGIVQGGPGDQLPMTGLTGPSRYYYSNPSSTCADYNNISLVGPLTSINLDQVVYFSGILANTFAPTDRFQTGLQYKVFDYSISPDSKSMIILSEIYDNNVFVDNTVVVSYNNISTPIPYRLGKTSRSVASNNALYILSISSCT
jgi:hypothetical protein